MAVMSHRKRGLGRDLEGLLGQTTKRPMPGVAPTRRQVAHLPVDVLQPGAYQPCHDTCVEILGELANSRTWRTRRGCPEPCIDRRGLCKVHQRGFLQEAQSRFETA
jgi:hypothetical protein